MDGACSVELPSAVKEERVRRRIDRPTQLILLAAFISFLFSIYLWFFADKDTGIFVGILRDDFPGQGPALRNRGRSISGARSGFIAPGASVAALANAGPRQLRPASLSGTGARRSS